MKYISVSEAATLWGVSERTVRNYCSLGKIEGAIIKGKNWYIPCDASRPLRINAAKKYMLLDRLRAEKSSGIKGGIYHQVQVDLTYNSNHIEGSKLSHDETRFIYETHTIGASGNAIPVNDIVETINHFRCIDYIIDNAEKRLTDTFIKELHRILKSSTSNSSLDWFAVGEYKKLPNQIGGNSTTPPNEVASSMGELLKCYNKKSKKTLTDLIEFHHDFECIHPFQDGNGRVGRLILFKECLAHKIVPFIIYDDLKYFYYRGLREWNNEHGFLVDTILSAQDRFKKLLDYFKIEY